MTFIRKRISFFSLFFLMHTFLFTAVLHAEKNAAYYKERGDEDRIQKNYLSAIEYYKKSLKKNQNYVPALLVMGSIMRETGAPRNSIDYLNRALKIRPEDENGLFEISLAYLDINDFAASGEFLEKGLKLYPQNPDFHFLSALLFMKSGNIYLAQKKINRTLKMNPAHYRSHLLLGQIYISQKRYEQAEKSLKKALMIKPENPEIFVELSKIHLEKALIENSDQMSERPISIEMFQDAVDYLLNAKGYDNYFVPANFLLGQIYALSGQCDQAKGFFDTVLSINESHYASIYFLGYCFPEKSLTFYQRLLEMNYNDEITRHHYEKNQIKYHPERKHPVNIKNAMLHYDSGKSLMASNFYTKALYEVRWSLFLFPDNIEARKMLASSHRSRHDLVRLAKELKILREKAKEKKYRDMYEQLISARQNKLYYKEGITEPEKEKSPTPLFVFNFQPKNPFGVYPDAGAALAEKINFALSEMGRLKNIDAALFREENKKKFTDNDFGIWGSYNGNLGKKVKKVYDMNLRKKMGSVYKKEKRLKYGLAGSYNEINGGIEVSAFLVDLETGREFAPITIKETGRGYLRNISISMAKHIFQHIPFSGQILKLSGSGLIVNLGKRDQIDKDMKLLVTRNGRKISELKIQIIDLDVLWAKPENSEDIYKIQKGDDIIILEKEKKKEKKEEED